ncbi:MAG TPA: YdjY domain-containing protein [Tepidisphaeraceae bacterium]|nr:YdjY domain-containing protein [Tepidisphaeraceae bacterium]
MLVLTAVIAGAARAGEPARLKFIEVDLAAKQVRVECEAIRVDAPLEFFCVAVGGPEHESVLRTPAKPSDIHLALLMLGLEPGAPATFSDAAQRWTPPHGPPVRVSVEFAKSGETMKLSAGKLLRSMQKQTPMPDAPFVFTGSRILEDRRYAADVTGYVVSLVNFDLSPIDVPQLASNANDTLEWQINPDTAPEMGQKVIMILEPVGGPAGADSPDVPSTSAQNLSDTTIDQAKVDQLQQLWEKRVTPHDQALRAAAQAQYDVLRALRREQQRLIDEADRIQRLIDEIERKYQDMTTPRPGAVEADPKPGPDILKASDPKQ